MRLVIIFLYAEGNFKCCFLILLKSCVSKHTEVNDNFPKEPIRYASPNTGYRIDSSYLVYTVRQFNVLGDIAGYQGSLKEVNIDTIIYSPDSLKLIALVITEFDEFERDTQKYEYEGHAILGYRLKIADPWIVYPFHRYTIFVGYNNYNMVRDKLRQAYFYYLKDYALYFWNRQLKQFREYPFYNVTDSKFWDSGIIWKKDVSILGYHQFQLTGNGDSTMPHPVLKLPEIRYPDSFKKLYDRGSR